MSFLTPQTKSDQIIYHPSGFSAGGLNVGYSGGGYNVDQSQNRTDLVSGLSGASGDLADTLGGLRSTVAPGFNDLLKSRLTEFNNNAASAIGNLRENLSSRRILGSSFGQDTITRAEAQNAQGRDQIVSDNFLKSLQASTDLANQEFTARRQQFQSGIDELNLEVGIASSLTSKASDAFAQIAQTQAKLDEDASKANATNTLGFEKGIGSFLTSPTKGFGTTPLGQGFSFLSRAAA